MFNSVFIIALILFMLSISWHIILKGRRSIENFWLFIFLFFQQFLLLSSIITYFPFYSGFFFFNYIAQLNFAVFFVYAFPRSVKIKKIWASVITLADILLFLLFHISDTQKVNSYLFSAIIFFSIGFYFALWKLKYLKKNRRTAVFAITFSTVTLASLAGFMSYVSMTFYNVAHFKWGFVSILPLYYGFLIYILLRKVESGTNFSTFLIPVFGILSIPLSFLFIELSSLRVSILSFFSIDNFFVPAAVISFAFLNIASVMIFYLTQLMNDYFNMKHIYLQKLINKFRTNMQNITTYEALFAYFDSFLKNSFKEIKSIKYISEEEEYLLGNITILSAEKFRAASILDWFDKTKELFLLKNSAEFPLALVDDFNSTGAEMIIPFHGKNNVRGLILIEAKSIKMPVANCISTLVSIMMHNIMRIALFETFVENEKKLQVERHFNEVDKMVSIIAHEIRTPLTSIMFNIELIAESLKNVPEVDKEFIEITTKEIRQLNESVQKMLTYGRNIKLEPYESSFNDFAADLKNMYSSSAIKINFSNKVEQKIKLDWSALKQVLINLINNSIHAIEKSGKGDLITVSIFADSKIRILVSDNGPGIPEEVIPSIFQPFYTTKKDGNGLGLAICEKIIKIMGGKIVLKETSKNGTTFSLSIPLNL